MFFRGRSTGIGLDMEDNRMRMAALTTGISGLRLEGFGERAIPVEAMENGRIKQPEILADVLRDLWSSLKTRESRIVAAVPNHHVFVRNLTLPVMKKREVFKAAQYHFLSILPLPLEETVIQVSGTRPKEAGELEATLVAARRSQVEELTTVIALAGLKPVVIEIRPLAARRALGIDEMSQILVDSGIQATHLSYFEKGHLRFTRTLFFGGAGDPVNKGEFETVDQPVFGEGDGYPNACDLTFEIKRSLEYWSRESGRELELQKLVVIGSNFNNDFLAQIWNGQYSIEVEWGTPWRTVQARQSLNPQERLNLERRFCVAFGLAARGRIK